MSKETFEECRHLWSEGACCYCAVSTISFINYQQSKLDTKDKELNSLRLAVINLTDNQSDHLGVINKSLEAVESISKSGNFSSFENRKKAREVLNSPEVKQYRELFPDTSDKGE